MTKVFVYGSLKKGKQRHAVLENSKFIGGALSERGYKLIHFTKLGFPAVIKDGNITGGYIVGEVYEVDDDVLALLDMIEGYKADDLSNSLFLRDQILVEYASRQRETVLFYRFNQKYHCTSEMLEGVEVIDSGEW